MQSSLKLLILLPALVTTACTSTPSLMDSLQKTDIIQSQNDNRQYQAFTLDNELKVLIISDPDTKKAAASLDVFIGSSSNPEDRDGLAHFLEHMLFLGTEKYPDPDEYQAFIAQHGGSRNAYTANEHTNYFFEIENTSLEPMLDRFSQFFTAPLFNSEFVEREKNAVNSEYLGKIKNENRRFTAAIQQAFNPKSPYSKFSVGSLETLDDRENQLVRDDLLKFYKAHYSANLMSLVVLANEPLPVLKQWVNDKFAAIPNYHASKKIFTEPLLTQAQMGHRINIESLQEKRELSLMFPLPETQSHYLAKPGAYFQSLLGHEGEGSILALLKAKGWADGLSASSGFGNNAQESSLYISVNLTKAGLKHVDNITGLIFQYIRLLQKNEIQAWLFQEQQQMARLHFRYQEKIGASRTVTTLSQNLHYYPTQDVIRGSHLMEEFKPELIKQLLNKLTPERVLISLNSQNLSTDKVEKNYQVAYGITPISTELLKQWSTLKIDPKLSLPAPNPFIPNELHLKSAEGEFTHPQLIQQEKNLDVWHQLDTSFKVPRNSLFIALHSPIANNSPHNTILTWLLTGMLNKQLNSYAYPARLAGLNYSINSTKRGMNISLSGYDQQQAILLERIIAALKAPEITEKRFNILKNRYLQSLNNAKKQQPFHQIISELKRTLVERHWTNEQKLTALQDITRQDLSHYATQFLEQLHTTLLIQGNKTEQEAEQIAKLIKQQLGTSSTTVNAPPTGVIQLQENSLHSRKLIIDNRDAALALYFQAPDKSIENQAKAQLLSRIISSAFFADLRTKQQLGYNLAAGAMSIKEVPGMIFIIQSPVISAPEIESRFHVFIKSFQNDLKELSEEKIQSYKTGLLTLLLEKDKSLQKRSNRNWSEIDRNRKDFDTKEKLIEAVKGIDKAHLMAIYQEWLIDNPRQFRSYALGTQFSQDDFTDVLPIEDTVGFKKKHNKL